MSQPPTSTPALAEPSRRIPEVRFDDTTETVPSQPPVSILEPWYYTVFPPVTLYTRMGRAALRKFVLN